MFISWIILSGENTFKRLNYNQKLKWLSDTQESRNISLLSGLLINDRGKNTRKSVKQFITPQITRMNQIQVRNIASLLSL